MSENRNRKWFCRVSKINGTTNGIYEYDFDDLYNKLVERYKLVLFALHNKDNENIHCHIVIQNDTQIRFDTLKNLIPYGDIEKQRGTNQECYEYCLHIDEKSKETEKDTYDDSCIKTNIEDIELWKSLGNKLGDRNDLIAIVEDLKNGASSVDIRDNYPSQYVRYNTNIQKVKEEVVKEEFSKVFRKLEVTYIYGSTGVGKTRYVMEKFGYDKVYRISSYGRGAFDGYSGQDVILFDEFRSSIPIASMLMYLDGYPVSLPCRYMDKQAQYTKVYIVSNIPLSSQYEDTQKLENETYLAFCRRINFVYNFDVSKTIPLSPPTDLLPINENVSDIF
jgi:hypothetical protein